MNYSSLIEIQLRYHQVCSSDFISASWFQYVSSVDPDSVFEVKDYRVVAPGHFTLLSVLSSNARDTAGNALQVLLQTQYVAAQMMSQELFESEITTIIDNWRLNTIAKYLRMIQLTREIQYGNKLFSTALVTHVEVDHGHLSKVFLDLPTYGDECSCRLSLSCNAQLGIYPSLHMPNHGFPILVIPTMLTGCLPTEALLRSTLECFYIQSFPHDSSRSVHVLITG